MVFVFKLSLPLKNVKIHLCESVAWETKPGLVHTPCSLLHYPSSEVHETQPRQTLPYQNFCSFLPGQEFDGCLTSLPGNVFLGQDAAGLSLISADLEVGIPSTLIILESKRIFATALCSFLLQHHALSLACG